VLAFSVQEEIGLRGAGVAAHYFDPDLAFAIDSTPARDFPDHDGRENVTYNTRLGCGPAIYFANSSTVDDVRLIRFLEKTALDEKIPFQFRQPGGGGTNSGAIQDRGRECLLSLSPSLIVITTHPSASRGWMIGKIQ